MECNGIKFPCSFESCPCVWPTKMHTRIIFHISKCFQPLLKEYVPYGHNQKITRTNIYIWSFMLFNLIMYVRSWRKIELLRVWSFIAHEIKTEVMKEISVWLYHLCISCFSEFSNDFPKTDCSHTLKKKNVYLLQNFTYNSMCYFPFLCYY